MGYHKKSTGEELAKRKREVERFLKELCQKHGITEAQLYKEVKHDEPESGSEADHVSACAAPA